jgi:hypothetical protein
MRNNGESIWTTTKPILLIIGAVIVWAISFILFVVGLQFSRPIVMWGHDLTVPVSAGIAVVMTIMEVAFVDSVMDDEKDWMLGALSAACYILGTTVGYLALMSLLSLGDPMLQKVVAGTLSFIFEVAPERMLVWGLRKMDIDIDFSKITRMFQSRQQPRRPQNQPRPQNQTRPVQPVRPYQAPKSPVTSNRTPRVQRPGMSAHTIGSNPTGYIEEMEQLLREDLESGQ